MRGSCRGPLGRGCSSSSSGTNLPLAGSSAASRLLQPRGQRWRATLRSQNKVASNSSCRQLEGVFPPRQHAHTYNSAEADAPLQCSMTRRDLHSQGNERQDLHLHLKHALVQLIAQLHGSRKVRASGTVGRGQMRPAKAADRLGCPANCVGHRRQHSRAAAAEPTCASGPWPVMISPISAAATPSMAMRPTNSSLDLVKPRVMRFLVTPRSASNWVACGAKVGA